MANDELATLRTANAALTAENERLRAIEAGYLKAKTEFKIEPPNFPDPDDVYEVISSLVCWSDNDAAAKGTYRKRVLELQAEVERLRTELMGQWQGVESAPMRTQWTQVWVLREGSADANLAFANREAWISDAEANARGRVLLWAPCVPPPLPKTEEPTPAATELMETMTERRTGASRPPCLGRSSMAEHTGIEWTDATWNPITGCSVVSPGCTNCYAMRLAGTRLKHHPSRAGLTVDTKAGPVWTGEVRFNEQWLDQPLRWKRPRNIFVCAHGDLFHRAVPFEWVDNVFGVMAAAQHHRFQVLTKRPDRALEFLREYCAFGVIDHVLIGVSVEDQIRANERRKAMSEIAHLGWRTWVSYEPSLSDVNWAGWDFIRWMVAGDESGPGARPSHPDWHRRARDWCVATGVPFFRKQAVVDGRMVSLPPLDGRVWDEVPR